MIKDTSFDPNLFLRKIVSLALKNNASDIHITPFKNEVLIRFRIAGVMKTYGKITHERNYKLLNVLKNNSGLDFNETRIPQDGKIPMNLNLGGKPVSLNLRLSTMPTIFGENLVMRILITDQTHISIDNLLFSKQNLEKLKSISNLENGLVLVAGGTGSGKTTTLYSILGTFDSNKKTIFTLEDPIEYVIPGYIQSEVTNRKTNDKKENFTFQKGLNGILRQDPDIILVGEIRDKDTASICLETANTGHIVFGSIHANSALSIISRLQQLQIQNHLIATGLKFVIYQKLVKKLCHHCCIKKEINLNDFEISNIDKNIIVHFANKNSCDKCDKGYDGLVPVNEIIKIDETISKMIFEKKFNDDIYKYIKSIGFIDLFEDGLYKSVNGYADFYDILQLK
ncbi:GspE/PulE family protein [Candidatus Vampirococcus lugosii]|uniref:Type II secretion system protein E n=1 Tax=Candidatus Vampirococcus lugosii TaxID=2789015 RepID=A0ABS5QLC0_9BACT|nr:ATPase, T2SS/T4P/T4SS family [Candidatus Vampirococcus lugosii]MBS8121996.1 type II secretion system protein E [Candidatus Vampirococcus lugosii]